MVRPKCMDIVANGFLGSGICFFISFFTVFSYFGCECRCKATSHSGSSPIEINGHSALVGVLDRLCFSLTCFQFPLNWACDSIWVHLAFGYDSSESKAPDVCKIRSIASCAWRYVALPLHLKRCQDASSSALHCVNIEFSQCRVFDRLYL